MAAIAEAADVSIETIYLSIGGKPSLVRYLVETAISGADHPVPSLEREGVHEIRAEADPQQLVDCGAGADEQGFVVDAELQGELRIVRQPIRRHLHPLTHRHTGRGQAEA